MICLHCNWEANTKDDFVEIPLGKTENTDFICLDCYNAMVEYIKDNEELLTNEEWRDCEDGRASDNMSYYENM